MPQGHTSQRNPKCTTLRDYPLNPLKLAPSLGLGALFLRCATRGDTFGELAKVIVDSIEQNPAPTRIALGSDAFGAIQKALTDRRTVLEGQREVAFSIDFPR